MTFVGGELGMIEVDMQIVGGRVAVVVGAVDEGRVEDERLRPRPRLARDDHTRGTTTYALALFSPEGLGVRRAVHGCNGAARARVPRRDGGLRF